MSEGLFSIPDTDRMSKKNGKKRKARGERDDGVIIKYLTKAQYNSIVKRKPVRIMINKQTIEFQCKDAKKLREIEKHRAKIKELQKGLK